MALEPDPPPPSPPSSSSPSSSSPSSSPSPPVPAPPVPAPPVPAPPVPGLGSLPRAEFGFPGPLRDRLVAAVLDGSKTSTTGLVADYEHEGEPLPEAGRREVVVDSRERPVAVIEVTEVRVVPLAEVDLAHAVDEGEGDTSVAGWRAGHERFWHGAEMRAALGDPGFTVDDATPVVLERFRVVTLLPAPGG
ncbi:ASCH domain-containing protein [Streptomyces anthocyanicus]|uniref:ASCH domain-containing protein n=1 Tax=Streptomyces anthocyanicus TaxID=68174 RepID=UPI00187715DA|nr:ASCH domain-containing protein [Streptomyces anthocyanicus]WTE19093.1 ASCH domain-containing protein [Streptomyces anthocyanicus]GHC23550.1 ASCH domain-containing protein [Streptomyces anthocyanicus]